MVENGLPTIKARFLKSLHFTTYYGYALGYIGIVFTTMRTVGIVMITLSLTVTCHRFPPLKDSKKLTNLTNYYHVLLKKQNPRRGVGGTK